jgi:predicted RNase H-like HicB family nuclease
VHRLPPTNKDLGTRRIGARRDAPFRYTLIRNRMDSRYTVALKKTDDGFSVWVPGLPGCASQGETEQEALENIRDAIQEYLAAAEELVTEPRL